MVLQIQDLKFFIKTGTNGSAMARHGLILCQNEALPIRNMLLTLLGLVDAGFEGKMQYIRGDWINR